MAQNKQMQDTRTTRKLHKYTVGTACYALYCGPTKERQPKWIEATVVKVLGSRTVNVKLKPRGPTWKRHIDQLRLRYHTSEDAEPPEDMATSIPDTPAAALDADGAVQPREPYVRRNPRLPDGNEYTCQYPRRSKRSKPKIKYF